MRIFTSVLTPLALAFALGSTFAGMADRGEGPEKTAPASPFVLASQTGKESSGMVQIPVCAPTFKDVKTRLAGAFAEEPISGGLQDDGNLLSIFVSSQTGTWTAVTTSPQGMSCIVAVGHDWQSKSKAASASWL
jgi:hypothetical protein